MLGFRCLSEAAINGSNLSELELTLGGVAEAVEDAEQSVTFADRSADAFERMSNRTIHADALHQAGRRAEAEKRFREAEQIQAEHRPKYPIFPSPANFNFCELLLVGVERAAWHTTLGLGGGIQTSEIVETCQGVEARARKTLSWDGIAFQASILSPSLDHFTLGRAALYAAIMERSAARAAAAPNESVAAASSSAFFPAEGASSHSSAVQLRQTARHELDAGVGRLRRAGPNSALEDLDEGWEIAERGPMRLFMADVHLYRSRLFHAVKPYPWNKFPDSSEGRGPKDDLKGARKLIEKCGYWRRKEELEDAEEAAKGW